MYAERRPPWYLLTGLIIGIVLGLVYAWALSPVERIDTFPASMRQDYKDQYRAMIAAAYVANGDLGRARARLALLGDADPARAVSLQAQLSLGEGSDTLARSLGILAADLDEGESSVAAVIDSTPEETGETSNTATPTPTAGTTLTPTPTLTPLASRTPTPTFGADFVAQELYPVCEPEITKPLIQVYVFDAARQPVPGVKLSIAWDGGQDTFYTGLKPEFSLGYADFEMAPEVIYSLRLAEGGEAVTGLAAHECENDDIGRYFGSWRVNFVQPE